MTRIIANGAARRPTDRDASIPRRASTVTAPARTSASGAARHPTVSAASTARPGSMRSDPRKPEFKKADKMNDQEKKWFEQLHEVKANLVKAHEAAKEPIERWFADEKDLYSDTAHFVYELLQNADDAGSSEARFVLREDGLVFAHCGKGIKRFTISSFETKEIDEGTDRYGSVNALTDRNGTTKTEDNKNGNAIGKFGRGFKSVYGYTSTPHIYDENLRFKLEHIVIPVDLSAAPDFDDRRPGETLFFLPFDRDGLLPEEAVRQILKKFEDLVFPTLFLRHLKKVRFSYGKVSGVYEKVIVGKLDVGKANDRAECVRMSYHKTTSAESVAEERHDDLVVFTRKRNDGLEVSVGFFLDEDGSLKKNPKKCDAFCFFPTKHETDLSFIIHAPFKLNATREGIKDEVSESHNGLMVGTLSELASDSVEYLRDIKDASGKSLVGDDILDLIPTRRTTKYDYKDELDLSPFGDRMREKFKVASVIPTKSGGHVTAAHAYWPDSQEISNVFSESQLQLLTDDPEARWVFASRWADVNRKNGTRYDFVNAIKKEKVDPRYLLERISETFVAVQTLEWLLELHRWIEADRKDYYGRRSQAKARPIFLNQLREPVAACDASGESCLFLPGSNGCVESRKARTVLREFVEAPASSALLTEYGVHAPSRIDDVRSLLDEEWDRAETREDHLVVFKMVFEAYREEGDAGRSQIRAMLKEKRFLGYGENKLKWLCEDLYFRSPELEPVLRDAAGCFIDLESYLAGIGENEGESLRELLRKLGVKERLRVRERTLQGKEFSVEYMANRSAWGEPSRAYQFSQTWTEQELDGLNELLNKLGHSTVAEDKSRLSAVIWKLLEGEAAFLAGKGNDVAKIEGELFPQGSHEYSHYGLQKESFDNFLLFKLRTSPWLLTKKGELKTPADVSVRDLPATWRTDTPGARALRELLRLKVDPLDEMLEEIRGIDPKLADWMCQYQTDKLANGGTVAEGKDVKDNAQRKTAQQVDPYLPLDETVKRTLAEKVRPTSPRQIVDILGGRAAAVMTIPEFFSMNLRIPDYQRPYKWEKDNVWDFLDDINRMVIDKKIAENEWADLPYRMGSIILHKELGDDGVPVYNIVDGQQRTLTFILLALALNVKCDLLTDGEFYPSLVQMPVSRRNLNNNLRYITDYLKLHENNRADFKNALERSLQVVAVCVTDCDSAFQLFDSQNVKGRRLEPHDLLKAYHLRELNFAQEGQTDKEKSACANELVEKWENYNIQDLSYLFDKLLYPILKWSVRERCYGFTTKDLRAFKGVPQRRKGEYGYVKNAFASVGQYSIGTEFVPGEEFFKMVSHYQSLLEAIRKRIEKCPAVKQILGNGSNNAYLKALFEAVLLAYFDRFGFDRSGHEPGLPKSDVDAAIQSLCKWVYTARLDLEHFSPKTPNKYALGLVAGSGKYTNRIAMFFAIRNAIFHTDIAKITINMSQVRKDSQPTEERKALWDLIAKL